MDWGEETIPIVSQLEEKKCCNHLRKELKEMRVSRDDRNYKIKLEVFMIITDVIK